MATLERVLPSLELKRRRLQAAWMEVRAERSKIERELSALLDSVGHELPMAADDSFELEGMVRVGRVRLRSTNIAGVRVPEWEGIDVETRPYSLLARPHWIDTTLARLRHAAELRMRLHVCDRRVATIDHARRRTTQRVNLFEKVLIPRARREIREIEIYLGDLERAAVVRSKVAKAQRAGAES